MRYPCSKIMSVFHITLIYNYKLVVIGFFELIGAEVKHFILRVVDEPGELFIHIANPSASLLPVPNLITLSIPLIVALFTRPARRRVGQKPNVAGNTFAIELPQAANSICKRSKSDARRRRAKIVPVHKPTEIKYPLWFFLAHFRAVHYGSRG